jgi:hypothetical protein
LRPRHQGLQGQQRLFVVMACLIVSLFSFLCDTIYHYTWRLARCNNVGTFLTSSRELVFMGGLLI